MQIQSIRHWALAFATAVAVLAFSGWASADPPSRVARLGYMTGAVSFSPAGENDWVLAQINRPLTTGDRLWADAGARAEIQVGGAWIRMSAGTGVSILNLDDRIAQLQLTQGTLNVRVRRLGPGQVFEVDTPNLAFTLRQPGEYRIDVDPDGNATTIVVRKGQGEVYGEDGAYLIDSRQPYRFAGTGLREYQYVDAPRPDDFDRWASDRDRIYESSVSARYVSPDVIGYQDLDDNGSWRVDATYGNVWIPNRVAADWAPYRDGHWAWVDPWGWTWVDDAPWGFAVSHYGRWTNLRGTWGWVPGPVRSRAYYAPALVAFVGGSNFQLTISSGNVGGVAWFPLGPREVYRPSYPVSRGYFDNVNRSNTVISTTVINNYYNNSNVTNVVYANRQVPGAIVAVPTTAFVQSQPVSRAAVRVSRDAMVGRDVAFVPPVAPTEKSVRGAAAQGDKPPSRVFTRPVVARTAPPPAPAGFAAQQEQLAAKPGRPLDDAARKQLKPAEAAAPPPVVKVVAPAQAAAPTQRPPAMAPSAQPGEGRGKRDEQKAPAAQAIPGAPGAPSQAAPPATAAQPPEQRGKAEKPPKAETRAQPAVPPTAPPQRAAPAPAAAPPIAAPPPAAQPQEPRGKPEKPAKVEPRAQPVAPPAAAQERVAPAPAAAPPIAAPAPAAQPQEPRGRAEKPAKAEPRVQPVAPPPAPPPAPPQRVAPAPAAAPQVAAPVPAPQAQEPRGRAEKPAKAEPRAQPVAPPPAPPQRVAPAPPPVPQIAPPVPAAQPPAQRAKPEPAPAARQDVPRPPVAAPAAAPPPSQPAPKAEPRGQQPKPAAAKPDDKKKDADEQKREDEKEKGKQKN
jgi:hypothetical protein